ncbi:hypothetical protein B296_00044678 [Ensete ventricosum]|uniref:Uncharacterized protein n=1 Tax=Ensete ventricosum TaxID=4639 RepID=A0A426Y231_ENSVE|nr:hypothetical protein B296_00044678 [Ensete ventricosum]
MNRNRPARFGLLNRAVESWASRRLRSLGVKKKTPTVAPLPATASIEIGVCMVNKWVSHLWGHSVSNHKSYTGGVGPDVGTRILVP